MNQLCWCGNPDLQDFSPEYWRCDVCSTLISKSFPSGDITAITDEDGDFYGKKYWLEHQVEKLGLETIEQRSRSDLLDRCGWWLAKLLEFSLPPAWFARDRMLSRRVPWFGRARGISCE
jgi:hypothetical protein